MGTNRQLGVRFTEKGDTGVPGLLSDLQLLLQDIDTTDVVFIVGKDAVEFHAHRLILWARCRRFQKIGQEYWKHKGVMSVTYPQFDGEIFRAVLQYIYTGQIALEDNSVFAVLGVAEELGITHLKRTCQENIQSTLSISNACGFYAAAIQMEDELQFHDFETTGKFSTLCAHYIEENAQVCAKTEGWLELPKSALTQLLKSDEFALEEEEVWRSVLEWAKYHAGVPLEKSPSVWNEHEKSLVCEALSGVINHVKLLLIDSAVFAEEVEPTGAVPMELSLERYRYAAVPHSFDAAQDRRLRPRVSHKLFQGTEILTGDKLQYQRILNNWYGNGRQSWRLLYRASRDGYTAEEFHKRCDGHSPTFVILMGMTGNVCGGFSDVPWTSKTPPRGRYIASKKCFLFTLVNNQGVPPSKFEVSMPHYATCHHPSYGPMFGAGADLCVAGQCETGMECYSNMPHSYSGQHASSSILMGDYNFNVLDYEVFTLATNLS